MEKVNSGELIVRLQKEYEKVKLWNDNLRMKIQYTSFALWSVASFLIVAFACVIIIVKIGNIRIKLSKLNRKSKKMRNK